MSNFVFTVQDKMSALDHHFPLITGESIYRILIIVFLIFILLFLFVHICCVVVCVAPIRFPIGVSPLVQIQKLPTSAVTNLFSTKKADPVSRRVITPAVKKVGRSTLFPSDTDDVRTVSTPAANGGEDVSSPAAARARCHAIHLDYTSNRIRNPATIVNMRQPSVPLQKAVLLSTGQ